MAANDTTGESVEAHTPGAMDTLAETEEAPASVAADTPAPSEQVPVSFAPDTPAERSSDADDLAYRRELLDLVAEARGTIAPPPPPPPVDDDDLVVEVPPSVREAIRNSELLAIPPIEALPRVEPPRRLTPFRIALVLLAAGAGALVGLAHSRHDDVDRGAADPPLEEARAVDEPPASIAALPEPAATAPAVTTSAPAPRPAPVVSARPRPQPQPPRPRAQPQPAETAAPSPPQLMDAITDAVKRRSPPSK
jgi:hypothetical protein